MRLLGRNNSIARLLGKLRDVLITPGMIEKGADKSRLSE